MIYVEIYLIPDIFITDNLTELIPGTPGTIAVPVTGADGSPVVDANGSPVTGNKIHCLIRNLCPTVFGRKWIKFFLFFQNLFQKVLRQLQFQ